jgi:hypothetical protein
LLVPHHRVFVQATKCTITYAASSANRRHLETLLPVRMQVHQQREEFLACHSCRDQEGPQECCQQRSSRVSGRAIQSAWLRVVSDSRGQKTREEEWLPGMKGSGPRTLSKRDAAQKGGVQTCARDSVRCSLARCVCSSGRAQSYDKKAVQNLQVPKAIEQLHSRVGWLGLIGLPARKKTDRTAPG